MVVVGERFSKILLGRGDRGSFYNLGGVPWCLKTLLLGAMSLLQWSILSNRPGTAVGMELPCDK